MWHLQNSISSWSIDKQWPNVIVESNLTINATMKCDRHHRKLAGRSNTLHRRNIDIKNTGFHHDVIISAYQTEGKYLCILMAKSYILSRYCAGISIIAMALRPVTRSTCAELAIMARRHGVAAALRWEILPLAFVHAGVRLRRYHLRAHGLHLARR